MQEVPNVVAAYRNYHDQGFDVIGVSLDEDKQAMLSVTQSQGMTWPQYFDGRGWENKLAKSFGIQSIPTMWLVNKKGELVNTDARGHLETEVATLLAE
jgi:thioredoxin-related protein